MFPCVSACVRNHSRNLIRLQSYSLRGGLFILPRRLTRSVTAGGPLISTECVFVYNGERSLGIICNSSQVT